MQIGCCRKWRHAGHCLCQNGCQRRVLHMKTGGIHLTGMHLHGTHLRPEIPGHGAIVARQKLYRNSTVLINRGLSRLNILLTGFTVQAGDVTDHVVQGHQRKAKTNLQWPRQGKNLKLLPCSSARCSMDDPLKYKSLHSLIKSCKVVWHFLGVYAFLGRVA